MWWVRNGRNWLTVNWMNVWLLLKGNYCITHWNEFDWLWINTELFDCKLVWMFDCTLKEMFDCTLKGMFDCTLKEIFDYTLKGMFDGILKGMFDCTLKEIFDWNYWTACMHALLILSTLHDKLHKLLFIFSLHVNANLKV